jgi:hypothetical protein
VYVYAYRFAVYVYGFIPAERRRSAARRSFRRVGWNGLFEFPLVGCIANCTESLDRASCLVILRKLLATIGKNSLGKPPARWLKANPIETERRFSD